MDGEMSKKVVSGRYDYEPVILERSLERAAARFRGDFRFGRKSSNPSRGRLMNTNDTPLVPVTVNLHITPTCNYNCEFCYAVFRELHAARSPEEWIEVIRLLAEAPPLLGRYKIDKLTFAGGEPTLVPYLTELLRATRDAGLVPSLVTNGT